MASEAKRGCGYRHVGGLYLVGNYISVPCDRLPFPLHVCPVCGAGIKVGRGMTRINPLQLFGVHEECADKVRPCFICDPEETAAYIMRVGERYYPTPEDFISEGVAQGVSKRIAQVPRDFEIGRTVVYLAHINACVEREPVGAVQQAMNILENASTQQPRLVDAEQEKRVMGIFAAFIPQRIEKIYWQSDLDAMTGEERASLEKRGITPVGVPDGDKDHV